MSAGADAPDIVVAGAGHNSLIAAAYLTRGGHRCRVLDARPVPGGGVATEELLLPGYLADSCSTGHTLIQTNPLLAHDELGLVGEHGLTYLEPDPVAHVVFPDGESLTMWRDLERTCAEIERFSRADATAYRQLLADYDAVKDVFAAQRFTPVGFGPAFDELLDGRPGGARWLRRATLSAWQVVRHEFESRHVQAFMLWMAFQTGQPVDSAGSGPLAYSIVVLDVDRREHRLARRVPLAVGGLDADAAAAFEHQPGDPAVAEDFAATLLDHLDERPHELTGAASRDRPAPALASEHRRAGRRIRAVRSPAARVATPPS